MTADPFRCSESSEARDEPIYGTASYVTRWLLLEQPGAWGPDAVMDSRLPRLAAEELRRRTRASGIRIILLRRGARASSDKRQCYFVRTGPGAPYQSHLELDDLDHLLDIDLTPLRDGGTIAGLAESIQPLFLVCTHGRHDACCSIRGNQVSRIACVEPGKDAWECSHIGGDRFAANLVCFPHGIYYGRVDSGDVVGLMNDYEAGELRLDHYRGRSCYPFPVQAAEYLVRREADITAVEGLTLLEAFQTDDGVAADFSLADGRRAEVQVRVTESGDHRLTCRATNTHPIPRYDLAALSLS